MTSPPPPIQEGARLTFTGRRYPDAQYMAVWVEGGKVVGDEPIQTIEVDPGVERWIVPGFFDLQINGFAGRGFVEPNLTVDDVVHVARAVLATGVTRFLPTIITASIDVMCRQLTVITDAIDRVPLVKQMCPGVHVEGPFIHPDDGPRGAHPREHVRPPNVADYERLREAAAGHIAILTLAPDQAGAPDLIRHAAGQGVIVALGHHRADIAAIDAAVNAGAKMTTHLGNGSDATLPRLDNPIWNQLGDDRLWASFISDGHHLPARTLRCMLRAKRADRRILVTDAVAAAGMPPGRYRFGGTDVELTAQRKVVLTGTPYLAGSAADMPLIISHAVIDAGLTLLEAVSLASVRPAMLMPGWSGPWSCMAGAPADLVELDFRPADGRITVRQIAAGPFSIGLPA